MLQLCLLLLALWPQQEQEKPLPDLPGFIAEFRKTLRSDNQLLGQYTYTEKETEITLDSKGNPKKTQTNVYQVIRGRENWQTYRRQTVKNGVPLTEKELEKQDREEKERIAKETRKQENRSESKKQQEKAKAEREEKEAIDAMFDMYDVQIIRREFLEGTPTILVTFKTKPNYKAKTRAVKIMQHIAGRAWIAEDDHELAKLEAEVIDTISIGAGMLARLKEGSTMSFERRKVNNEIWLPVKVTAAVNGRLLLFKGLNLREETEYSDHKKYSVDTILTFGDPIKPKP